MTDISPHLKTRVQVFFKKGEHKLRKALHADLAEEDPITDEVCMDCQTSAEFFLKTFLLANRQGYKKYGHDLEEALQACIAIDSGFKELTTACEELQDYRGKIEYELGDDAFPPVVEAR